MGQGWAKHPGNRDFPGSTRVNFSKTGGTEGPGDTRGNRGKYIAYYDERTKLSQPPKFFSGYPALLLGEFSFFEK